MCELLFIIFYLFIYLFLFIAILDLSIPVKATPILILSEKSLDSVVSHM